MKLGQLVRNQNQETRLKTFLFIYLFIYLFKIYLQLTIKKEKGKNHKI